MRLNIQAELRKDLGPKEHLIWTGQPKKGIIFRKQDIFLIPFSILWCSFAIFWLVSSLVSDAPLAFSLFGVPFVVLGLFFVFGRFILDAKLREGTCYGLTKDRILIKSGIFSKSIQSVHIETIPTLHYTEKRDGMGTLVFGYGNPRSSGRGGLNILVSPVATHELTMIPKVRTVYQKILELQKEKKDLNP